MSSGVITPILATTGIAFANKWYSTGSPDLKIPVAGAIAAAIGAGFSQIPGFGPVMASIGWIAFLAVLIAPVQNPPPIANVQKIIGGL